MLVRPERSKMGGVARNGARRTVGVGDGNLGGGRTHWIDVENPASGVGFVLSLRWMKNGGEVQPGCEAPALL